MNEKLFETSIGKKIYVYDDVFSYAERVLFFNFFKGSLFKISGYDIKDANSMQVYSSFSKEDLNNLRIMNTEGFKALDDKFNLSDRCFSQVRVNYSFYAEKNYFHEDGNILTFLYYPNLEWNINWGGHIFFLTEDTQEIEYCVAYKPGRTIVFDGSIPHLIMTPTIVAESPRISFAIQYTNGDKP